MINLNQLKELTEKIYYQLVILRFCCKHLEDIQNPQAISYLTDCTCKMADKLYVEFLEHEIN